jgi:hypothetical protein
MESTHIYNLSGAEPSTSVEPVILAQLIDFDSLLVIRHEGNAQAQRCITISDGVLCIAMPAARLDGLRCGSIVAMASVAEAILRLGASAFC